MKEIIMLRSPGGKQKYAVPLYLFLYNHAERVLRGAVLWRKGSFGSSSEGGCRFVERILTVVQTLRLQGRPVLTYLPEALSAHRKGVLAPKLLPAG
jgi:transposase